MKSMGMSRYTYEINGREYEVAIGPVSGSSVEVTVNGIAYHVRRSVRKSEHAAPAETEKLACRPLSVNSSGIIKQVVAPLPGVITSVSVSPGDSVRPGQTVAVLESMKMENEIQAEYDGMVVSVEAKAGDPVLEGEVLAEISLIMEDFNSPCKK